MELGVTVFALVSEHYQRHSLHVILFYGAHENKISQDENCFLQLKHLRYSLILQRFYFFSQSFHGLKENNETFSREELMLHMTCVQSHLIAVLCILVYCNRVKMMFVVLL